MSLLQLRVRYGGHWVGLEYVDGESEMVDVVADKGVYVSLLESVHHIMDVDNNEWTYILDTLVVVRDVGVQKKKLRNDHHIINLFVENRLPIVFVTLRKNRLQPNLISQPHMQTDGASCSYFNQSQVPNSTPVRNNLDDTQIDYDWGIHPCEYNDANHNDPCEDAANKNICVSEDDGVGDDLGGEDVDEVNATTHAHFEEFRLWWDKTQVNNTSVNDDMRNNRQVRPRLYSHSGTAVVSELGTLGRWIIPGAPTSTDDSNEAAEDHSFLGDGTIRVGAMFSTKEDLTISVGMYHVHKFGEYRTKYSDKKRLKVICKSKNCPFMISASGIHSVWRVYEVVDHTCTLDPSRSGPRRIPSKVLGAFFAPRLLEENSTLNPRGMISELQQRNSVHVTYDTALRAKNHAIAMIYGDQKKSFATLPSYLYMLKEMNPGSITALDIDFPGNIFRNAFFALGASISGFRNYSRPVILVDGTHLKGKYNGILFVAVTLDGNSQIFPLAVGIDHVEDDSTWTWFLEQVRSAYGCPADLVIVSDSHISISNAIKTVFPDAFHCLCYYHMKNNMKAAGKDVVKLFFQAAYSFRKCDFEHALARIRSISEGVFENLIRKDPKKWARCQCPLRRYEFMTTNTAESFNKRALWARKLPITSVFEVLRSVLEKWFYERRTNAEKREHDVTASVVDELGKAIRAGSSMDVNYIDSTRFKVRDGVKILIVDLTARTCTCCQFDQMLIPCSHAAAAIRKINHNIYAYVDNYYKTSTLRGMWSGVVMPIPDPTSWTIPSEIREVVCLPPERQRQAGRPRQSRFSAGPSRTTTKRKPQVCLRCGGSGHNSVSCNEYLPLPTVTTVTTEEPVNDGRRRSPKKCSICQSTDHTRRKCPNLPREWNVPFQS